MWITNSCSIIWLETSFSTLGLCKICNVWHGQSANKNMADSAATWILINETHFTVGKNTHTHKFKFFVPCAELSHLRLQWYLLRQVFFTSRHFPDGKTELQSLLFAFQPSQSNLPSFSSVSAPWLRKPLQKFWRRGGIKSRGLVSAVSSLQAFPAFEISPPVAGRVSKIPWWLMWETPTKFRRAKEDHLQ